MTASFEDCFKHNLHVRGRAGCLSIVRDRLRNPRTDFPGQPKIAHSGFRMITLFDDRTTCQGAVHRGEQFVYGYLAIKVAVTYNAVVDRP